MPTPVPPHLPLPSDGELRLLRTLWERGPSTVREVHDGVAAVTGWGYTTVLKLLQIMHAKRLVIRDESRRTHVYAAAAPPERTRGALATDLAERAFGGSAAQLAMHVLSTKPATPAELAQLRDLLDALDRRGPTPR